MKIIRRRLLPKFYGPDEVETTVCHVYMEPCPRWCTHHSLVTDSTDRIVSLVHHGAGAFWLIECRDDFDHRGRGVRHVPQIHQAHDDIDSPGPDVRREIEHEFVELAALVFGA